LAQAGLLSAQDGLKQVLSVWRGPERLARAGGWRANPLITNAFRGVRRSLTSR
jgi:hypothetical protein